MKLCYNKIMSNQLQNMDISQTLKMNEKITNHSNDVWKGRYFMQTKRRDMPKGSSHVLGFHTFFGIAISSPDKPYNKIKFADLNDSPVNNSYR